MKRFAIFLILLTLIFPAIANSQSVSENWLRQAGITCGGGQTEQNRSELETELLNDLAAKREKSGTTYSTEDLSTLLGQFSEQSKTEAYKSYVECLKEVMKIAIDSAAGSTGLPERDIVLESPAIPSVLSVAKRGDKIFLKKGDSVAIRDLSLIFTLKSFSRSSDDTLLYTWSNSETGIQKKNYLADQGDAIFIEDQCVLVPYEVSAELGSASFLVNC